MLPTPIQIREKLLTQLDDKNEVDEPTVVELISILEHYPFTGAMLEETRIGKMANELRKRIKNEKLAKKLKQLIRSWQSLAPANGSPGQAMARLPFIPHVSPSPRVAYSAQQKGMPHTPTQSAQLSASPALQSNKSAAVVGRKGTSPGAALDHPVSLRVQGQVSPALAGCRKAPPSTPLSASCHVTSPKVSGQVPSPAVPRNVTAKVTAQTLSAGSSRAASPALSKIRGHSSSPVTSSPVQSPALLLLGRESSTLSRHGSLRASSKIRRKRMNVDVSENSNVGGRVTPSSVHSENSQDRVIGETNNGRQDSDGGSSCSSRLSYYAQQISHSTDTTLTKTNSNNSAGNQKELSKANVSSRKRVRTNSTSPPETHKKPKTDTQVTSLESFARQKPGRVVNGHKKSGKKSQGKAESSCDFPCVSQPVIKSVLSPPLISSSSDSRAIPPQSDILLQQESDTPLSAHLAWLARDKSKGKVKTTEQLIKDLQRKNSSSNVGNSIMTKLRTNQIEKERDVSNSVLPAGMKPRGKRGKRGTKNDDSVSVPSSDGMISKNELVEHFLKTSEPSSSVDDYGLDALPSPVPAAPKLEIGACSNSCSKDSFDGNFSASRQDQSESAPKDENSMDAVSPPPALPPVRTSSALTLDEIYAQLPPINYNIDWDSVDFYNMPERAPVTDECVGGLHSDRLPGVNGVYDINGDWTTWQQTLTLPSYEGEPLHILPYVDLDN